MNGEEKQPSQLFIKACREVENFALAEVKQEAQTKQLYYHNLNHVYGVKRRANIIFQALKPTLIDKINLKELNRIQYLLNICAVAHDLVQEFSFSIDRKQPRERPVGLSETLTIDKLINHIQQIERELSVTKSPPETIFTEADIKLIKEAIQATSCQYDYANHLIYQPYLYQVNKKLNITAQIIALADLGTLGMEGIEAYLQEGILLFLEENLDIVNLVLEQNNNPSQPNLLLTQVETSAVHSDLKERLLKYTRYLVKFARGRKTNFEREIASFDEQARIILRDRVFINLTEATISQIESIVPTSNNTTLAELLEFFNFDYFLHLNS